MIFAATAKRLLLVPCHHVDIHSMAARRVLKMVRADWLGDSALTFDSAAARRWWRRRGATKPLWRCAC